MITLNGSAPDLLGLHTDTKPDDAMVNSLFLELDTGDFYYFTGEEWVKVGEAPNDAKSTPALNKQVLGSLKTEKPEVEDPVIEEPAEDPAEDPAEEISEEVLEDGETR